LLSDTFLTLFPVAVAVNKTQTDFIGQYNDNIVVQETINLANETKSLSELK